MAAMAAMAPKAWALSLLVLALSGSSAQQCDHEGRFWDGCNWCWCRDGAVLGCTSMACIPVDVYRVDPNRATIGPPKRDGMFAYRPGRGRVVDPSGWPCQLGSSWLEEGGCVRCICANKMIKCRDSGMCLNGEPVSNDLLPPQEEYVRRRRDNAAVDEPGATAATAAAESTTSTAWAATEPAAATTAAAGVVAEAAEATVVPGAPDNAAPTPAPEAANATQSTVAPLATTTAQNTVVKDRSCRSGSTWEEDCNSCWCLDNGRAACTTNSCEPPPLALGAPGTTATTTTTTTTTTVATVPAPDAPAAAAAAPAGEVDAAVSSSTPAPQAAAAGPAASTRRKRRVVLVGA